MKREILLDFPKVDLHCHLEGSVRLKTIYGLAKREKVKLPTENIQELKKYVQLHEKSKSLIEFLSTFEFFFPLLKNTYAVARIAYELCEDVSKENIKYLEVRLVPCLLKTKNYSMDDIVRAAISGFRKGMKDFKIEAGIILCACRSTPIEFCYETIKLADKYKNDLIVGVDLIGYEYNYNPGTYKQPFELAKKSGINISIHTNEIPGYNNIKSAIEILFAERIGHGLRLEDDKELFAFVKKNKIPVEICLTSNVQTREVNDFDVHPLREYYKNGIEVTINTDNRSVSGIDLTNEWQIAIKNYNFTIEDLIKINLSALKCSFIRDEKKKKEIIKNFKIETEIKYKKYFKKELIWK